MGSVYITHNGCQMRSLDASKIAAYFKKNGYELCNDPLGADYSLFISCSGIDSQVGNTFETINWLDKETKSKLIILGCTPATMPDKISEVFNGHSIPLKQTNKIDELFPDFKYKYDEIDEPYQLYGNRFDTDKVDFTNGVCVPVKENIWSFLNIFKHKKIKKTASIKICDGCNSACSYCNIKIAVGKLRSLPAESIIKTYKTALQNGFNNIVFMGDDTGAYGTENGSDLPSLMRELLKHEKGYRPTWAFDEMNPQWLLKYKDFFFDIAKKGKLSVLACPMQSGSQRIIDLMNRPYNVDEVIAFLKQIKKINKNIEIHTHIIIGFPSETEEDFNLSSQLFDKVRIDHSLIASYSEFDNTRSKKLDEKITKEIRKERIYKLQAKFKEKEITFLSNMD
ncbi:MAG: radical SAM protein [Bacteroidales bacterium]|jgi:MiaB/RimO family radical SAM methylthiotransferase|nr:radical SAM protein [Bacteroidales bacterium]